MSPAPKKNVFHSPGNRSCHSMAVLLSTGRGDTTHNGAGDTSLHGLLGYNPLCSKLKTLDVF